MKNKKILLFPGQGSQYAEMSKEFVENFPKSNRVYECGSDILGYDLKKLVFDSILSSTEFAQPAIFAASLVSLFAMRESGVAEEYNPTAGHSLGEYAALVGCGVLDIENGFKAIKARTSIMAKTGMHNPGGMAAVIGLSLDDVLQICTQVCESGDYVVTANFNTEQQSVISGTIAGLEKAEQLLKAKGAKRVIRLKVSAAFHSELMAEAAEQFKEEASKITFMPAKADFYSNVTFEKMTDFSDMAGYLAKHICSPVMFVPEIQSIHADGYDTFIEVGPGKVVTGLVKKILGDSEVGIYNVEDMASLEKTMERL